MKFVSDVISRKVSGVALLAQKASPELLLTAGVIGMVGSTVLACRATLKMDTVMDEAKEKLNTAKTLDHPDYSEQDRSRDVALIYFQSGVQVVKLYGPAIIVGGLAIASLTTSHKILSNRNIALTAAYTLLDQGFKEYRGRVVDIYGEEVDRDLRYGTHEVEIVDPETKKKKKVIRVAPGDPSMYARFFDETSSSWSRDPENNMFFLKCQQNYANDLLKMRGHVFLNEVYDMVGVPRSRAGSVVGWMWNPDAEDVDNFINFGIFDGTSDVLRDFVNGHEGSILLDFNVDGVIYNKIEN